MDIDTFVPVSSTTYTRSFAVVLGLNVCTNVRSSLGDRTRLLPERYDGCVVPWCLYSRTIVCTDERGSSGVWKLLPRMNQRSTIYFLKSWLISFDFPMMSSKRGTEFEGRP